MEPPTWGGGVVCAGVGPTHVGWCGVVGPTHVGLGVEVRCLCGSFGCASGTPEQGVVSGWVCVPSVKLLHSASGARHGDRGDMELVYRWRARTAHRRVVQRGVPSTIVPAVRRHRDDRGTGCRSW